MIYSFWSVYVQSLFFVNLLCTLSDGFFFIPRFDSGNISVGPPMDILEYANIEWKGDTKQAEKLRMVTIKHF